MPKTFEEVLNKEHIPLNVLSKVKLIYNQCDDPNLNSWHGGRHINNTLTISDNLLLALGNRIDARDNRIIQISIALHDIGKAYGKTHHGTNGSVFAERNILPYLNLSKGELNKISQAIKNHMQPNNDNIVDAVVNLCDVLDSSTVQRKTPKGLQSSSSGYITQTSFKIEENTLCVAQSTQENFSMPRFLAKNFGPDTPLIANTIMSSIANVAKLLELKPQWNLSGIDMNRLLTGGAQSSKRHGL